MMIPSEALHQGWFRPVVGLLAVCVLLVVPPSPARAHPLGNFTINLYSRLEVGATNVDITYFVDMAEIPTFQDFGTGQPDAKTQTAYLASAAAALRDGLRLTVDGQSQLLTVVSQDLSLPPGQAGLLTTRISLRLSAGLPQLAPGSQRAITYEDTNYAGRVGWHEVIVRATTGTSLARSDAPTADRSDELRVYPQNMLASPLDIRTAHVLIAPGPAQATTGQTPRLATNTRPTDHFAALIMSGQLSPLGLALVLLLALGLGAAHALSPGHGKTIVGAYLIGSRGTPRHALFLGLTVTATHTIGVFALGLVTLYASRYILPEQLYPWLGLLSGLLVVGMGLTLFGRHLRALRPQTTRGSAMPADAGPSHDPTHHRFSAVHEHGPHTHTHLPSGGDGRPVSWRNLLALGISGGLVPCPSALLVMLSAIALHRVGFGLVLIVAFSLGLAGALTAVGLLFVYGLRWLSRMSERRVRRIGTSLRLAPVASAMFVMLAGFVLTVQAALQAGLWR